MADGVSVANATAMCTTMVANWTWTGLFKGAPGASGTTNVSSTTTRKATTWAAASGASVAANGTLPSWTSWAGTNGESQTDIGGFDASTAGNFQGSAPLSAPVAMNTGDSLTLTGITGTIPTAS